MHVYLTNVNNLIAPLNQQRKQFEYNFMHVQFSVLMSLMFFKSLLSYLIQQSLLDFDIRSHCLFPVVVTCKSGASCYHLVTRLITITDLLQVVPTRLIQDVRNKLLTSLLSSICQQLATLQTIADCWINLLRVCYCHQPCHN